MQPKKKTKRSKVKYPNLRKKYNSRVRQEFIDADYLNQLSPEELEWYNQFMGEYNNASLVLKVDEETGKKVLDPEKNLHQDPKHKKELYDKNNRQNTDLFGLTKGKVAKTKLLNIDDHVQSVDSYYSQKIRPESTENALIEMIDLMSKVGDDTENSGNEGGEGENSHD